jgi:hypothetical protein
MTIIHAALAAVILAQASGVNPRAAALQEFSERCAAYLKLRADLADKLQPLSPTASATELRARQDALTAAIRRARSGAKQGDVIPATVRRIIREAVAADFRQRHPDTRRAALEEVPSGPLPGINRNYPERAALPTVPPLLLANLPKLPDNLQYRFFGRHMVVLDLDLEIVIDYVPNVVPR